MLGFSRANVEHGSYDKLVLKERNGRRNLRKMSELSFDSESVCSSDPLSSIKEPDFGENLSDDSLNISEDIFPLSYSDKGWNSSDDHSCESFNMLAEVVVSDDDDVVVNKDLKRKPHKTSRGKDKKSSIFIPDGDYGDEIIFVEPENYSPRKKMKLDEEKRTAAIEKSSVGTDSEIAVIFAKKGIEFPHAREHCRVKTFVQISSVTTKCSSNEEFCDKCYCYVCDDLSSKCESWKTEGKPHCNAYAKHAFWERERNLHKRNSKKFNFVPILTLLAPEKINQEMTKIAVVCNKYADEIQEVSNSSYDTGSTNNVCYCHVDPLLNPFGCLDCKWERDFLSLKNKSKMQGIVLNATIEVEKHLQRKQPNPAIVILDTITSLLLGVDINSKYSIFIPEKDSSRLTSLWIEAALNMDADRDLLSKAKERLSKSVKDRRSQLFLPEAKKIHEILSDLRPYDDPLVVKCLMKNYKGSSGLKESYEVTKVRLKYFKANNKISEAINYILGVETPGANSMLCDYHELRDELVDLLITKGRMQKALTVCKTYLSNKLPTDLHVQEKTSNGKPFNFSSTPTKSISMKTFKNLFLGLAKPKTTKNSTGKASSSISQEGLRNAMTITLPGLYVNRNLNSLDFFEFLFDEISAQHRVYKYTTDAVRKDVQQSASTFLDTIVKKGNKQFQPEDIKAQRNIPLPVYVIEILLQVASARYSVLKCLQSLVKKQLYWACKTLISSSPVQDAYLQPEVVTYFTKTILPKTDCGAIPDEVFKKWIININAVFNFNILFDLVCEMFNTGSKRKGLEGVALKKKAMILSQTLTESVLIHSYGQDRSNVERHLKAVQEKFPSDTAKKLAIPTTTWGQLEIEFVYKPNFQALEAIRNSMGSQNKVEFLKKQNILIQFLKKNSRFLQKAVIEIFVKREMYKDLLECLNGVTDGYNGYEINFSQINTSLEEVKRMGDKNKAMSLAEALKDYVSSALVQASFSSSFRQYTKPIHNQVSKCVKMFHSISRVLFMSIIKNAIDTVIQKYLRNTVSCHKREELGRWLLEIKAIFISVHEILEWSVIFKGILQGPLKRKQQIITTLQFWKPSLH